MSYTQLFSPKLSCQEVAFAGDGSQSDSSDTPSMDESQLERFQKALGKEDAGSEHEHSAPQRFVFVPLPASGLTSGSAEQSGRAATSDLAELVSKMVDKMWVTQPATAEKSELRLELKGAQFSGTELKIVKSEGSLLVQFSTATAASYQHLLANRSDLVRLLQQRHGNKAISVDVGFRGTEGDAQPERAPFAEPSSSGRFCGYQGGGDVLV